MTTKHRTGSLDTCFFSPVKIDGLNGIQAMGLGPMAVHPEFQRRGIGSALVTEGLNQPQVSGCVVIVVVGHAEYYPRFGFSPAGKHGLKVPWDGVPEDVFMVKFTKNDHDGVVGGTEKYSKEFNDAV